MNDGESKLVYDDKYVVAPLYKSQDSSSTSRSDTKSPIQKNQ